MTRQLSVAARRASFSQETDIGFLILLTIDHSSMEAPLRFVAWDVNIPSRGNTYYRFPFEITLPKDSIDDPPRMQLRIDNVDRTIVQTLRTLKTRADITVEIVTTEDPDTVEASFTGFKLSDVQYDAFTVSGSLEPETLIREPYPSSRFTPGSFRGVF